MSIHGVDQQVESGYNLRARVEHALLVGEAARALGRHGEKLRENNGDVFAKVTLVPYDQDTIDPSVQTWPLKRGSAGPEVESTEEGHPISINYSDYSQRGHWHDNPGTTAGRFLTMYVGAEHRLIGFSGATEDPTVDVSDRRRPANPNVDVLPVDESIALRRSIRQAAQPGASEVLHGHYAWYEPFQESVGTT